MTREEAFELLDLPTEATNDDIIIKYRELYSDYMLRLTNAPTPNLKKIYSNNIEKLEEAFKLLCPDADVDETQFLPTDRPNLGASGSNININISNKVDGKKGDQADTKTEKKPKNKKPGQLGILMVLISVVFFAAGLSFFIMYFKRDKVLTLQDEKIAKLKNDSTRMHSIFGAFEKNGKLELINKCQSNVTVKWMSVLYIDEQNQQINHVKFYKDYPLKPGQTLAMENFDNGINWDGKVIFYDLRIERANGSNAYFNGIWKQEQENGKILLTPPGANK